MKYPIPTPETLRKYLAGKCTENEYQLVNEWYQRLDFGDAVTSDTNEDDLYERIHESITEQEIRISRKAPLKVFWTYAVSVAAVLCMGIGLIYFFYFKSSKNIAGREKPVSNWVSFKNNQKKIIPYLLPDSTVVWLNPDAKISYQKTFFKRDVRFSGEAFFNVVPDKSRPFTIYSGELKTRVLGTSFNIRANAKEATCQVTVVTGMVEVGSVKNGKPVILRPKQQVVFVKNSNALSVKTLPEKQELKESWHAVSLVFDEVAMSEVAERLEKIFHITIEFEDPAIKKCRLKVDFNNQRLPEILETIDALLETTYQIEGETITLRGEGCH